MFENLLDDIRGGGTLEINTLAAKYDTTPQMITAMLGHLERLGAVVPYIDCGTGCDGCGLSDGCSSKGAVRLWQSSSAS